MKVENTIINLLTLGDLKSAFLNKNFIKEELKKNIKTIDNNDVEVFCTEVLKYNQSVFDNKENKKFLNFFVNTVNKILGNGQIMLRNSFLTLFRDTSSLMLDKNINLNDKNIGIINCIINNSMSSEKLAEYLAKHMIIIKDFKIDIEQSVIRENINSYHNIIKESCNEYYRKIYEQSKNQKFFHLSIFEKSKDLNDNQMDLINNLMSIFQKYNRDVINQFDIKNLKDFRDILSTDIGVKYNCFNYDLLKGLAWLEHMKRDEVKEDALLILKEKDKRWSESIKGWYYKINIELTKNPFELEINGNNLEQFLLNNIESLVIADAIANGGLFNQSVGRFNFSGKVLLEWVNIMDKNKYLQIENSEIKNHALSKYNLILEIENNTIFNEVKNNTKELLLSYLEKKERNNESFGLINILDISYYGKNDVTEYDNIDGLFLLKELNNIKSNIVLKNENNKFKIIGLINANENIKNNFINTILAAIYTLSDRNRELDFIEDEAIIKIVEETNSLDAPMQNKIEYIFSLFRKEVLSSQIDHKNNVKGKRKI